MKFYTQIEPEPSGVPIDANARITALGSCFAEVIGARLDYYKWPVLVNPLGVLFHPLALSDLVTRAMMLDEFTSSDLFEYNGIHYILSLHGKYSDKDPEQLLNLANRDLQALHTSLTQSTHVLITLGTAWAYEHVESQRLVGNCHKLPGAFFKKKLLTADQIQAAVTQINELMARYNPKAQMIFSVSPVRHIKDGLVQNSLGKAHLISGVHAALDEVEQNLTPSKYFPAYELMVDQLRDYRFYKSDLIHPNDQGELVVWEFFKTQWLEAKLEAYLKEVHSIQQGLAHRPLRPDSQEHRAFLSQLKTRILSLEKQYPHLKFD